MVVTDDEATNTFVQVYNYVKPAKKLKTWDDYRESIIEGLVSSLIMQRLSELTQKENPPFVFANTALINLSAAITLYFLCDAGREHDAGSC